MSMLDPLPPPRSNFLWFWEFVCVVACLIVIIATLLILVYVSVTRAHAYTLNGHGKINPNSVTCQDVREGVARYGVEGLKAMGRANGFTPNVRQVRAAQACLGQR